MPWMTILQDYLVWVDNMNQKPIRRISEASKAKLANSFVSSQDVARSRVAVMPEPFGLNRLYDGQSPLSRELSQLLIPSVRSYVYDYFKNDPKQKAKSGELWRKFLPESPSTDELKAIKLALSPRYYWSDFINLPEVRKALVEDAAYSMVDVLVGTADFLEGERKLLSDWEAKRPSFYDFANKNTLGYINKIYPSSDRNDPECADGLAAIWQARMAAFRLIDAHFTGHQTYIPSPRIGGVDNIFRKLTFNFSNKLEEDQKVDLEKRFGFIKIGDVATSDYGTSLKNVDQQYLELAYAETDIKSGQFSYNNLATQVMSFVAPVLSMPPEKVKQKGLVSLKFLYGLYTKAKELRDINELKPLPEIDMQDVYIDIPELGENLEPRFSQEWCRKRFISPAWLAFAGFRPVIHKKTKEALQLVFDGLPEFAEQLSHPDVEEALVQLRTRTVVLEPVIARGVQKECLSIYQALNPKSYQQTIQSVHKKYQSEREVDRVSGDSKALQECFLIAVNYITENQEVCLGIMEEKYGMTKENQVQPVYVTVPTSCEWVHPSVTMGFALS